MRDELKMLLLALAYECSQNNRALCDVVCPPEPPPCPPSPPPPPQPPPEPCKDVCEAAARIMGSIALGEAALAHIMNAEGEKIQAAIANTNDVDKLLAVNASVRDTLNSVNELEQTLLAKLQAVIGLVRGEKE
ncbi:MAG: hypothetical protein FWC27_09335 [Firmicutes bacterium]|nr:hypothetical protein [Bacillota bacterium]